MKKMIIILILLMLFIFLNDRAALYQKQILPPIIKHLPFNLKTCYYDLEYHILDQEKYFVMRSKEQFPVDSNSKNQKKIFIDKIIGVHWTNNRIIVEVISKKQRKLIEIEAQVHRCNETTVEDYRLVTDEVLEEMDDSIILREPSILIAFWPIIGILYLIGLIGLIFSRKVALWLGK